ncbi:MAG: hypothetical protein KGI71_05080 [Patescibacteria group bacterium]|nr:hypothetical protein [Patescibacteria group bacterium]
MANRDQSFLQRAAEFTNFRVSSFWSQYVDKWPVKGAAVIPFVLVGIYLKLCELVEDLQQGGTYFRITPFQLLAKAQPMKILDQEQQQRVRDVSIYFDSAVGGAIPNIRLSTGGAGAVGNGVLMAPGQVNELGKVPPDTLLFCSSDTTINGFIIERA